MLRSISLQTVKPTQVLIADDGSDTQTRNIVKRFARELPIIIIWQPNRGFRAARSRNIALLKITGDYTIFIDGDCMLPPHFVEMHLKIAEPQKLIAGSRALLSEGETSELKAKQDQNSVIRSFQSIKFWRIPLGPIRNLFPKDWRTVRTCNMAAHTADIIQIAGFDENYIGWGREDSDFVVRLLRSGITIKSARFAACVNHLYHAESDRSRLSANHLRFESLLNRSTLNPKFKSLLKEL